MLEMNMMGKKKRITNNILMHFDGANASTTFIDEYGHTFSKLGSPKIVTSVSKFGGSSGWFQKECLILPTPLRLLGDYTIEAFVYPTAIPSGGYMQHIASKNQPVNSEYKFPLFLNQGGLGSIGMWVPPVTGLSSYAGGFVLNKWAHIAAIRQGNVYKGFVDGVQKYQNTGAVVLMEIDRLLGWVNAEYCFSGFVDELRILDGTAAYFNNFTPPTSPFTI